MAFHTHRTSYNFLKPVVD